LKKRLFVYLLLFIVPCLNVHSQGWEQKSNLPVAGQRNHVAFSIGDFGYIGTGTSSTGLLNQFWKYDSKLDNWSSINNLPGVNRSSGIGLSINGKGYAGLGWSQNASSSLSDLYEYNPVMNNWTLITSFPGAGGRNSFAAAIQNSIYIGGGAVGSITPYAQDFWKFDITLKTWTQRASFPFGPRATGISFSNNSDVYVGLGHNGSIDFQDLWKYNSITNSWTQMANFPGVGRFGAICINIKGKVLVGAGNRLGNPIPLSDYYIYDIPSNTWSLLCNFNNPARSTSNGFAIDSLGFVYGGKSSSNNFLNDLWQVELSPYKLYDSTICNNSSIILQPTFSGNYTWFDNSNSSTKSIASAGVYWVDITNNGCTVTDSFYVNVSSFANINLGRDTLLCFGDSLEFNFLNSNFNYLWDNNSATGKRTIKHSGLYWIEANSNGCVERDSINVSYTPEIQLDLGKDTTLCFNETMDIDLSQNSASFLWEDNSTNPIRSLFQPGLYWAELSIGKCFKRDSILVNVSPEITLDLGKDTVFCQQVNLSFDVSQSGASYLWDDNSTSPQRTISQVGLYWVQVNIGDCSKRDSILVSQGNRLDSFLGNDSTICFNNSIVLNPGISNATYLWQDGSMAQNLLVSLSGLYWVEVNEGGCISRDSILITVNPKIDLFLGNDSGYCEGGSIVLENKLSSTGNYLWNDGSNGSSLIATATGSYYVQLNQGVCFEGDTIEIIEFERPVSSFPTDTFICLDESFSLSVFSEGVSYLWNTGSTNSSIQISDSGLYTVSISNQCGSILDSILVEGKGCDCYFYMPNVFTPNNDGINENFKPIFQCEIIAYEMLIYNRWGNLLFNSKQIKEGWNGKFNGKDASLGSYIYSISMQVKNENRPRVYLGSFTLLK
jgi:gliding motility-associated-like protein